MDGSAPQASSEIVPLKDISAQPGFNPRRHFDDGELASLAESIRQQGVIQPILLRYRTDGLPGLWLVCGERRFRCAGMAGLEAVPAVVREMSDRQAFEAAMHENQNRVEIGPSEEAWSARRALDICEGNEADAARMLGWPRDKLRSRNMLLHAVEGVLEAVADKRIRLGHAELLATLPEDLQRSVLAKVLEHGVSVEDLRTQLSAFTQDLSAAAFDTSACNGCVHNSSTQGALFAFSVGAGRCADKVCWGKKTTAHLAAQKAQLAEEYPVVYLDVEKDPALYTPVAAQGEQGVGDKQFTEGCRACARFGVIVSTRPGTQGRVSSSQCFDLSCNAVKRTEFKAAQTPVKVVGSKKGAVTAKDTGKSVPVKATVNVSPKRVTELIDGFVRETVASVAAENDRVRKAVQLYALRSLVGGHSGGATVGRKFDPILKMSDSEMDAESSKLISKLLGEGKTTSSHHGDAAQWAAAGARLLADAGTVLTGRFKLTKDFVAAHTKSGIEALLASASFHVSLEGDSDADKEKALKRLVAGKHGDIVRTVMRSKHDFSAFLPPSVEARVKALRKE